MIPRVSLAILPTPIESMPHLSGHLRGPQLFIKRDDMTGLATGGNKTRKLEFLLAEAIAQKADLLITAGAIQSNHCRQVAAAAARYGLGCILVLTGKPPELPEGNFLLDHLLGAKIVFSSLEDRDRQLINVFEAQQSTGYKPYLIPYGGSNAIGGLAYADAFEEMLCQGMCPDWIVFASSSGGTQAGMVVGAKRSEFSGSVLGISVDAPEKALKDVVVPLVKQISERMGEKIGVSYDEVLVNDHYIGAGYGMMGEPEIEAIQLFARFEGIILDPVYTGRAAAGLIDLIRKGTFKNSDKVLFWHTGGLPALFAEKYQQRLTQQV